MRRGWRLAAMVLLALLASLLVIPPGVASGAGRSMWCWKHIPCASCPPAPAKLDTPAVRARQARGGTVTRVAGGAP